MKYPKNTIIEILSDEILKSASAACKQKGYLLEHHLLAMILAHLVMTEQLERPTRVEVD